MIWTILVYALIAFLVVCVVGFVVVCVLDLIVSRDPAGNDYRRWSQWTPTKRRRNRW